MINKKILKTLLITCLVLSLFKCGGVKTTTDTKFIENKKSISIEDQLINNSNKLSDSVYRQLIEKYKYQNHKFSYSSPNIFLLEGLEYGKKYTFNTEKIELKGIVILSKKNNKELINIYKKNGTTSFHEIFRTDDLILYYFKDLIILTERYKLFYYKAKNNIGEIGSINIFCKFKN